MRRVPLPVIACALLAACSTATNLTRSHVEQAGMPCTEAVRVASGALLRLGYIIGPVREPQPGVAGEVVGRRNTGWALTDPVEGTEYTATVTIACSNRGANFDALTDEPLPGSLSFKTDFASAVQKVAERRTVRPRLAENPETGLVIGVEPLRGSAASSAFDANLSGAGITPVRVRIDNRSERTYLFAGARVQLVTQEGTRIAPLAIDRAAPAAQAEMRQRLIADGVLAPQAVLTGFLFFPASTYRRATLVLIDQASEEEEGFSVEF
ncbi:MAG: hypothetical protein ACRERC_17790, partial [Candidatus Binatia bacterium]